ncbi:hypothetical protein K0M31_002576 [Melipona bicolor]|uniref:Uncharacterized protein n=1 Tax=Melipona bicolor TaxID=60889 RepID=A0AA40GHY4_9HYME|nr:hypothetical protein K0M31_002576 [Melipona bicolor]
MNLDTQPAQILTCWGHNPGCSNCQKPLVGLTIHTARKQTLSDSLIVRVRYKRADSSASTLSVTLSLSLGGPRLTSPPASSG